MSCRARLRNIQIESTEVRILSIEHISRVLLTWALTETRQNLSNLRFTIERSEDGYEWSAIQANIPSNSLYEFVDYTVNLFDLNKIYYYRVVASEVDPETGDALQTFTGPVADTNGDLDLTALYVIEEHLFEHRYVDGVPTLIYKKMFDGSRCPECWDEVLKKVTKSNCTTCFGTGRIDGYYPPIDAWMKIEPSPKQEAVAEQGVVQVKRSIAQFTNYPELRPGDLIFEPQHHYFWRVASVQGPEKNRSIMLQQLQLTAVNRSDVEYRVTIPQDRVETLLQQLAERNREGDFV